MIPLIYSEMNIFCILIVLLIGYKVKVSTDMRSRKVLFIRVLMSSAAFFLCDLFCILIENKIWITEPIVNWIANAIYFSLSGLMGFSWFLYSEHVQGSPLVKNRKTKMLCAIPFLLLIILIIISFNNGALYYIDETNQYHRGKLNVLHALVTCGYIYFTAGKAFFKATRTLEYSRRREYLTLASFILPPIIFGFFQIFLLGVPMVCIGITLGELSVYMEFQEQMISIDPLTQVNNRNQLRKYLSNKLQHVKEGQPLFLLMMDVDYFKKINDIYGHVEGDTALIRVADSLKLICQERKFFLARFGGDEFIVICETQNSKEIEKLCSIIQTTVQKANEAVEAPYNLSMSIGYAQYSPDMKNFQDFLSRADSELYKVKRGRQND